ncbi:hypothetical protein KPL78_09985 [Roseomonas sp. HJA6]|uniref:Blue (type 1) copper domain-containing protein n=1 Tax=Roseomonas alba TaxID=2846776 RepID=A0ABS7A7C6_9PROT|nr:hypothetical protein [Neoroseomonas alba]MBW6398176.1 hypothetical protein [Neoroseomonas alba]
MKRRSLVPLIVGTTLLPAMRAAAQPAPTVIRVALLDVSALMPRGAGADWPGQGPGWGGGMMGWGPGAGRGGGRGFGPGMMGMGMMSIRPDRGDAKTGPLRFEVTNWSRSVLHEMLIVAVDHPDSPLPYDSGTGRVPEDQVRVLGDTGDMQPNASATVDVTLQPGAYLLLCNLPGHYAAGMVAPFMVTR